MEQSASESIPAQSVVEPSAGTGQTVDGYVADLLLSGMRAAQKHGHDIGRFARGCDCSQNALTHPHILIVNGHKLELRLDLPLPIDGAPFYDFVDNQPAAIA